MDLSIILLLLLAPLGGFLINTFLGKQLGKGASGAIGTLAIVISFVCTLLLFLGLEPGANTKADLFHWLTFQNFSVDFSFQFDQLSLLWLLFVTGIGSLIHLYSISYMHHDKDFHKFFSYLNLFVFFMIVLVSGSNLPILFIGWEGVGLCSYLLIGFWYSNQAYNDAAKKAFIMNRVGDLGLLIGIFILATVAGTLDYQGLETFFQTKGSLVDSTWLAVAALCLFIGACGKSAQLPLYTWLPDAMAGPTPVSALIHAATMVTAGIFMVTRLHFLFDLVPAIQNVIAVVGVATALFAATIGLAQNDIKKVLAYSTVSQLGLMFLALGVGAYEVAVFHVITHAFFKACLFLGAGSVIHANSDEQDMRKMGGLRKVMPITFITMLISSLAIAGIFPLSGFWSKDEILLEAFHYSIPFWAVASLASILTAFYMFRLMFLTFFGEFRGTEHAKSHLHESPALMTIPLVILATLAAVGGLISIPGSSWLMHFLEPLLHADGAPEHHALDQTAYILMAVASVGALVGIFIAYRKYISNKEVPGEDSEVTGFTKVLAEKYYVDELYDSVFVKPINLLARFFRDVVETALGSLVYGFGKAAAEISNQGRKVHNGSIGLYLFVFVIGFCLIVSYLFLAQ